MKQTAYGTPLLIDKENNVSSINKVNEFDELTIQKIIFEHPSCLPISDIDEAYNPVIPVCMELQTRVGPLDIFMISPNGELTIIETKLWRNPEARRKVVAQILDYAKELSNWTYEDLQREVNRRLGRKGNTLFEIAKTADPDSILEEADFVDSVSRNLRRGNFLLLIVGDGIREGARGIAEFLGNSGHLNFTFAMVELNLYRTADDHTLLIPRTLVKTTELSKLTVNIPDGFTISIDNDQNQTSGPDASRPDTDHRRARARNYYSTFWNELQRELTFDDPGQPMPAIANSTNTFVYPAQAKKCWISGFFSKSSGCVGVYFRTANDQAGEEIKDHLIADKESIEEEFGDSITLNTEDGINIYIRKFYEDIHDPKNREEIKEFFKTELNRFVNVLRPRVKGLEGNI